jgi:hypothetical protein
MKNFVCFAAALIVMASLSVPALAIVAADSASDPAYASGWAAGSNGGFGFGPWDFTRQAFAYGVGPAAWGDQTHFIDNAPVAFNDLGSPAFAISQEDCPYCGGQYTSATRPFARPLAIGQTFKMEFDNPLFQNPDFAVNDYIIRFNDSAGTELFSVFGSNYFDGDQWNIAGSPNVSTGVGDFETASGSKILIRRTGTNTIDMLFNGTLFSGLTTSGSGDIAEVTVNMGGSAAASFGDGSREFFINNLQIVPEPASMAILLMAVLGIGASARRRK